MSVYRVLKTLWSIPEQRDVRPGEEVTIDDDEGAALLLARGCIEPVEYDWHEREADGADVC